MLIKNDLNIKMSEPSFDEFCQINNLKTIAYKPSCFKNPKNPSSNDLLLTSKQERFLKPR